MKIKALAPWFGSNRKCAKHVGEELTGCKWVGIPFAGSMAEIPHIKASTIVVNDKHENIMNLACVVANDADRAHLLNRLRKKLFHPRELLEAQNRCIQRMNSKGLFHPACSMEPIAAAEDYFVAVWMGRSGKAGTSVEFQGGLPVRWNANGGDSNTRYRSAVESLDAWGAALRSCNFTTLDGFQFLNDKVKDQPRHGLYIDPPFPDVSNEYRHDCGANESEQLKWHTRLRDALRRFKHTRVVCRFYDHPLIRELYPEPEWTWRYLTGGRDQANQYKPEILIINGPSRDVDRG